MSPSPRFGPLVTDEGVTFRLWAPAAQRVELLLDTPRRMNARDGWFELWVPEARSGAHYRFKIDGELEIPDPASHFQPSDVNGPSEVIDHKFDWECRHWKGLAWEQAVFLEAHVGTFTALGTFRAMIERLDHLVSTGITALELMPVADFPGRWNWGYDGALLYAPDSTYGRPNDLKMLIDAAHTRGLMIFLDVVYNHFGPEGNYLGSIAPQFFSKEQTPWGGAINYEAPEVRAFAIDNALHWLRDYRFDGLRLDAVHAIVTPGKPAILNELSAAVAGFADETGRHIHLVLENEDNRADLLAPSPGPAEDRYRAQWNDDYHHAWHVLLTGETVGYYADYKDAASHVARTLAQGFAYQGEPSPHRDNKKRGDPSSQLPRTAFVNFLQNHDQIGNRPHGERLTALEAPVAYEAALSVLLLQPGPPLLFMGEEWGATEPFPFFCDFKGELAEAVRDGRRQEFADAYANHGDRIPDPLTAETRAAAVLDWGARDKPLHAARLALTGELLAIRKRAIVPLLRNMASEGTASFEAGLLRAHWPAGDQLLQLMANLSDAARQLSSPLNWAEPIWGGAPPRELPPWSVYAAIGGR